MRRQSTRAFGMSCSTPNVVGSGVIQSCVGREKRESRADRRMKAEREQWVEARFIRAPPQTNRAALDGDLASAVVIRYAERLSYVTHFHWLDDHVHPQRREVWDCRDNSVEWLSVAGHTPSKG